MDRSSNVGDGRSRGPKKCEYRRNLRHEHPWSGNKVRRGKVVVLHIDDKQRHSLSRRCGVRARIENFARRVRHLAGTVCALTAAAIRAPSSLVDTTDESGPAISAVR